MKYFFVLLLVSFVLPVVTFAHETGKSFETSANGYAIDIGYNPEPSEGTPTSFDFELSSNETPVAFGDVWVQVVDASGATVLATGVHNGAYGGARLVYQFPSAGTYTVHARYETGTTTYTETEFPLMVTAQTVAAPLRTVPYLWLLIGVLGGVFLAWGSVTLYRRSRRYGQGTAYPLRAIPDEKESGIL